MVRAAVDSHEVENCEVSHDCNLIKKIQGDSDKPSLQQPENKCRTMLALCKLLKKRSPILIGASGGSGSYEPPNLDPKLYFSEASMAACGSPEFRKDFGLPNR